MSGHETIADIVAEMRKVKGFPVPYAPSGHNGVWATDLIDFADRIEAAWRHEKAEAEADALVVGGIVGATAEKSSVGGNAAAMREALVQCELYLGNVSRHGHPTLCLGDQCTACNGVDELRGMVVRALSAPARQCDVGTAEEQERRYNAIGEVYHTLTLTNALAWAQTPYAEEGGAS